MRLMYERCAGLDVHKKTVVANRRRINKQGEVESETQTFGTTTGELLQLLDWLLTWDVQMVAMESTGVYWKPIYNLFEGNIGVMLVNAHHIKHVPGRKTDVHDAEWIGELLSLGLLKASFVPPKPQRELRELTRHRVGLVQDRARVVNQVQKVLESANLKLASVASDPLGVSGRTILEALIQGERDTAVLAELAKGRLRLKKKELEQALQGIVGQHHCFLLSQQLSHIDLLDEQIESVNEEVGRRLVSLEPVAGLPATPPNTPSQEGATVGTDLGSLSWNEAVAILDTAPGINKTAAQAILAETGINMGQFPNDKHLTAWAGLAPGNNESGGKRYSGKTKAGNAALRRIMTQVAHAAVKTKDTYISAVYRRLMARRGKKRAITAVARKLLADIYYMLTRRQPYHELGADHLSQRSRQSKVDTLCKQLVKLGYRVKIEPSPV